MRLIQYTYPASRVAVPSLGFGRSPWGGLEAEIDSLFGSARTNRSQFPVDLYEDKDNTYVRAELPGVARENINVEIADGVLTIAATRKEKSGEQEQSYSVSRAVTLPENTTTDKVAANYENGVLTVTLPKPEQAKPRKVSVQVQ